jgi:putative ABC transport system permease protein
VALQAGKADVVIAARGGHLFQPAPFEPSEVEPALASRPELGPATPRWVGLVEVGAIGREQPALLIGVDAGRERSLGLWGLRPEPELPDGRCAISRELAKRLSVEPGSRIPMANTMGAWMELQVDTVLDRQLLAPQEVREYLVVNAGTARGFLNEPSRVHFLAAGLVRPDAFYDSRNLQPSVRRLRGVGEALSVELGTDYEVRVPKAAALMAFENLASPLRAAFGVFVLLALCVTGLLVYSIVSVAVEERVREFAVLRTLGARRSAVFRIVLGESALLCVMGVLPGVLAGVAVARLVLAVVGLAMGGGAGTVAPAWSAAQLWMIPILGAVLAVGSALVPAWQATRWTIVDALDPLRRGQITASDREASAFPRPWFLTGLALSAVSVVVFFVLPSAFLSGDSSLIGTVVLCLLLTILVGFTLLAVSALAWIEFPILRVLGWVVGPAAELGYRNLQRHRRRNSTTALMFILSVALVVFVASPVALFSRMSMTMVQHFNGADLRLESEDPAAGELKSRLAETAGVQAVSVVRFLRSRSAQGRAYDVVISDLVGLRHLWLVPFGVDPNLSEVIFANHIRYAEGGPDGLARVTGYPGGAPASQESDPLPPVLLSQAAARFLDVRAGDPVQLAFHLGAERRTGRFRVAAVCSTVAGFAEFRARVAHAVGSGVLLPMTSFLELTRGVPADAQLVRYLVKTAPDAAAQVAAAREIRDRYDLRFRFGVKSVVEQQQGATVAYWTTQVFFGLLLAVAVTISVFALIASMATAVLERRWEVGMLKALGLRRGQLFRVFMCEALGVSLSAGLAGGVIGFTLAWLFVLQAGALAEVPVVFALPMVTFGATLVVSVLAGLVAAYMPTRQLLRRSAGEILRMTG